MKLFRLIQNRKKGLVIAVNKWDLIEKETSTARDMEREIKHRLQPFDDVPVMFVSATEKVRIFQLLDAAMKVYENKNRKIKTSVLNKTILPSLERTPPPSYRGNQVKIDRKSTRLNSSHVAI